MFTEDVAYLKEFSALEVVISRIHWCFLLVMITVMEASYWSFGWSSIGASQGGASCVALSMAYRTDDALHQN